MPAFPLLPPRDLEAVVDYVLVLTRRGELESKLAEQAEFDDQGRVLIHGRLRESASRAGEVDVLGQYDYLEVWNHERFVSKLSREPFGDDDARALVEFGI